MAEPLLPILLSSSSHQPQQGHPLLHSAPSPSPIHLLFHLLQRIPLDLLVAVNVWIWLGFVSICTTKNLLTEQQIPPLVVTFQQLLLGSSILHLHLRLTGKLQSPPKNNYPSNNHHPQQRQQQEEKNQQTPNDNHRRRRRQFSMKQKISILFTNSMYTDLLCMGLFNSLDFFCSNTGFSRSVASFVETIKSSEPMTTSVIALLFGLDRLTKKEAKSIILLLVGVLFSILGNARSSASTSASTSSSGNTIDSSISAGGNDFIPMREGEEVQRALDFANTTTTTSMDGMIIDDPLYTSIVSCMVVMMANICFGMRVKYQKSFQAYPAGRQLSDENLLMYTQGIGACLLFIPVLIFELSGMISRTTMMVPFYPQLCQYWFYAIGNAAAFCSYGVASGYILTRVSVFHHAGIGCMRRLILLVATSIAYGVPITPMIAFGIALCTTGFCSFTYLRATQAQQAQAQAQALSAKKNTCSSSPTTTPTTTYTTTSQGCIINSNTNTNTNKLVERNHHHQISTNSFVVLDPPNLSILDLQQQSNIKVI